MTSWVHNPIDAFILAEAGSTPVAALRRRPSRADWLRRVTFDLTGLPPTPEEIEAFVSDRVAGRR